MVSFLAILAQGSACVSEMLVWFGAVVAFHDCVQHPRIASLRTRPCAGGLCVGMHNGPHEGGPASYPVGEAGNFTTVAATMTVPGYPARLDGITYYLWTDVFFGDMSQGRMNQFVPQLILGEALDGSSGPPHFTPRFGNHSTWRFGAHYFFEYADAATGRLIPGAAYGELFPCAPGEVLFTRFEASEASGDRVWTLTMGVAGDFARTSRVVAAQPYMGLGAE